MAIKLNLPNFLQAPLQEGLAGSAMSGLTEGLNTGLNITQSRLANALTRAKTANEERFGGLNSLSGPAKEIQSYEIMKRMYGENHPAVIAAKERLDATLEHTQASAANMRSLVDTAPKRYSTMLNKHNLEASEAAQGIMPGTSTTYSGPFAQVKIDDQAANRIIAQSGLAQIKLTTDPFTRRGLEQAQNIHITRDNIDPLALVGYSGVKGGVQNWMEVAKDQFGNSSEFYQKHQESLVAAKQMAKQIRQLLGDSISSEASEALNAFTNPSSWKVSPETALRKYEKYMGIIDAELETFYKAAEDPTTFNRKYKKNILSADLKGNSNNKNVVSKIETPNYEVNMTGPEGGKLRPPEGTYTKDNIMKAAKDKKWSKEKTDFVLKRYGYG